MTDHLSASVPGLSGALLAPEGSTARRVGRIMGIALGEVLAFVLVTVLFLPLAIVAVVVDTALWLKRRKPWMAIRLLAFLWWFLAGELRGLAGLFFAWLLSGPWRGDSPQRRRRVFALQASWAAGHLAGIRVIMGLKFEVEGDELIEPSPVLVLIRHASIIDNTVPATFISRPHAISLRYVLKHELQSIPTLDIGGHWIPTCFVRRGSDDAGRQVARVRTLGEDLGPGDGVLVYPEGTRFTPAKLARAKAKIRESDPSVAALADGLQHLLPPRLGGPLTLLDAASNADVVVCGHVGLDGFEHISDVWTGDLVGKAVRVRFWRHARSEVPETEEERIAWLYARWQALDDWVGEQQQSGVGRPTPQHAAPDAAPAAAPVQH